MSNATKKKSLFQLPEGIRGPWRVEANPKFGYYNIWAFSGHRILHITKTDFNGPDVAKLLPKLVKLIKKAPDYEEENFRLREELQELRAATSEGRRVLDLVNSGLLDYRNAPEIPAALDWMDVAIKATQE